MARNEVLDSIFRPQQKRRRFALPFGLSIRTVALGAVVLVIFFSTHALGAQPFLPRQSAR